MSRPLDCLLVAAVPDPAAVAALSEYSRAHACSVWRLLGAVDADTVGMFQRGLRMLGAEPASTAVVDLDGSVAIKVG